MAKADLILLAMDTSPTLGLLERALRASGYDVALAHNVDGLNRLLLETSPVVLLISQAFDGQDGIEIAQQRLSVSRPCLFCCMPIKRTTPSSKRPFEPG